jgi:hypothetical protein
MKTNVFLFNLHPRSILQTIIFQAIFNTFVSAFYLPLCYTLKTVPAGGGGGGGISFFRGGLGVRVCDSK